MRHNNKTGYITSFIVYNKIPTSTSIRIVKNSTFMYLKFAFYSLCITGASCLLQVVPADTMDENKIIYQPLVDMLVWLIHSLQYISAGWVSTEWWLSVGRVLVENQQNVDGVSVEYRSLCQLLLDRHSTETYTVHVYQPTLTDTQSTYTQLTICPYKAYTLYMYMYLANVSTDKSVDGVDRNCLY